MHRHCAPLREQRRTAHPPWWGRTLPFCPCAVSLAPPPPICLFIVITLWAFRYRIRAAVRVRACVRACAWLRGGPLLVLPRSTGAGHGRVPATGSMIGEGSGRIRLDGPLLRERWLFPSPGRMFIPCLMASVYSRSPGICSFHLLKLYIAVSSATCKSAVCSVAFALALPFTATLHRVQPSLYCIVAAP